MGKTVKQLNSLDESTITPTSLFLVVGEDGQSYKITLQDLIDSIIADGSITRAKLDDITRTQSIFGTHTGAPATGTNFLANTVHFRVPDDYIDGDILVKTASRNTVGSNTVARTVDCYRFRNGGAYATIQNAVRKDRAVATTGVVERTEFTITEANIAAGDNFWLSLTRLGSDAADTNTGVEDVDAFWIEYKGRA